MKMKRTIIAIFLISLVPFSTSAQLPNPEIQWTADWNTENEVSTMQLDQETHSFELILEFWINNNRLTPIEVGFEVEFEDVEFSVDDPGQVKVLNEIAKKGRDGFYSGEVAEDMVNSLQKLGGTHTMDDFSNMEAFYTNPIAGKFSKFELVEHPPNGQGATAILLCNILKHFPISSMEPFGFERTHIETEATKLAYDARNRLVSDPTVFDATTRMTSNKLAEELADKINMKQVINEVSSVTEEVHKDTIYITVVDKDQMAVSLIYSIFHGFGSGIASEKFGVLFQNRGAGFNLIPGHVNEYGAHKRPLHTIIPAIVKEKEIVNMPFGVMGGQYQAAGHARVLSNIYDFEMDIQAALDAPRSFFENGSLRIERGYDKDTVEKLSNLGHTINQKIGPIGGAQAIKIHDSGVLEGASDPRKDGCALGY